VLFKSSKPEIFMLLKSGNFHVALTGKISLKIAQTALF